MRESRSRSRCSTTHHSRSASSSCSTSRAAWRAICRCFARRRSSSTHGSGGTIACASARSDATSPSAHGCRGTVTRRSATSCPAIAPDALTPLWRATDEAMSAFGDGGDERRVILVLSDGKDSGPGIGFRQRIVSQVEVIDRARREDVMIYGIGMRSRGARAMPPGIGPGGLQAALTADLPDPGLARVAEEAGGGYTEIRFGQDLGAAFARVADELHSQYLIGFDPPKRDGKVHDIDIRLSQKGLKARGRKDYVAPTS